ncbi:type IV secretion system protein [Sphingomonas hylomeconis]|uniref:Type IV secretion system protein n=1 Tax=Sphingomonas hylomeconis TaxID=1395958 RepID=A0ABV7SXH3_9SPHN|nr:type IV secretion system protein [Sphingomonas hylomeconis]
MCPSIAPGGDFLSGVLAYVDCQAQAIGEGGYRALATPGSGVGLVLTAMLTIFVAMFGYRMLLGQVPELRDGVIAVVKLGVVLVLATSWPAFRTLAYDVTMHGPAELASSIGGPAGLPGAGGGLVARLQRIDNGLIELVELGTGKPDNSDQIAGPTAVPLTAQQQAEQIRDLQRAAQRPRWNPERDASLIAYGRALYLTGAIAAFASVRILAGLLLALGPLFALFLLFDATRGLFEGWVRGLTGAALGALATSIVLGVELALMEPWLAQILDQRRNDLSTPSVPVELLVVGLVFATTLIALLIGVARVAQGFRIPDALRVASARLLDATRAAHASTARTLAEPAVPAAERSRAYRIADAVAANQRREAAAPVDGYRIGGRSADIGAAMARDATRGAASDTMIATPIGQRYRRRTGSRVSAGAVRRDGAR